MSRLTTTKQVGDKVLVNTGSRRVQNWVPGVVYDTVNRLEDGKSVTEMNIILNGWKSKRHYWFSTPYVISDTPKNRVRHGLM